MPSGSTRTRRAIAAAIVGVGLVTASFAVGWLSSPSTATPGDTSAEAGFARDMQVHHLQAVEMAMTIRDLTDDEEVRMLAYDIATSQAAQSGQMYGWLGEWGLPQAAAEPPMAWMTRPASPGTNSQGEHSHTAASGDAGARDFAAGDPMPGYASPAQLAQLSTLSGVDAERYFLQLMIAHHEGGVTMAEAVVERSDRRTVLALAGGIVTTQSSEITTMRRMLEARTSGTSGG